MLKEKVDEVKEHTETWKEHSAWRKEFETFHIPAHGDYKRAWYNNSLEPGLTLFHMQEEMLKLKKDFETMTGRFYIFEHMESSKREESLRQKIINTSERIERVEAARQQMANDVIAEQLEIDSEKQLIADQFIRVYGEMNHIRVSAWDKTVSRDQYNSIVDRLIVIRQQTDALFRREDDLRERYWPSCNNSACDETSDQKP